MSYFQLNNILMGSFCIFDLEYKYLIIKLKKINIDITKVLSSILGSLGSVVSLQMTLTVTDVICHQMTNCNVCTYVSIPRPGPNRNLIF